MIVTLLVLLVFGTQYKPLLWVPVIKVIEFVRRHTPTFLKSNDRFWLIWMVAEPTGLIKLQNWLMAWFPMLFAETWHGVTSSSMSQSIYFRIKVRELRVSLEKQSVYNVHICFIFSNCFRYSWVIMWRILEFNFDHLTRFVLVNTWLFFILIVFVSCFLDDGWRVTLPVLLSCHL